MQTPNDSENPDQNTDQDKKTNDNVTPTGDDSSTVSFKLTIPVYRPLTDEMRKKHPYTLGLSGYHHSSEHISQKHWKPIQEEDFDSGRKWFMGVGDAFRGAIVGDIYLDELNKSPEKWEQRPTINGRECRILQHDGGIAKHNGEVELTGSNFMAAIRAAQSTGATIAIPLYHSGFWITLRPAKHLRWLAFDTERITSRVNVARDTTGMILSTRAGYEQMDITNFALEHVNKANVENFNQETLMKQIKAPDIPIIAWACAAANYVDGHPYAIPCLHDPSKCTAVEEVNLDLRALSWTNKDKLSDVQKKMISNRTVSLTEKQITEYQKDGLFGETVIESIGENITIEFQIPSAFDHFEHTRAWGEQVVETMDEALSASDISDDTRYIHLLRGMSATRLREFSPWISKIRLKHSEDLTIISSTTEDVINFLDENSGDLEMIEAIHQATKKYIERVTINVIGYPQYECPKCGNGQHVNEEFKGDLVKRIIPMDPFKSFFSYMDLKFVQIRRALPIPTGKATGN